MPKVPMYQGGQVSNRPVGTNYDNTRISPDQYGGALGEALTAVGGAVNKVAGSMHEFAMKKQAEDDPFAVEKADLEFGKTLNEQLHSEQHGFLNRQGENALDYSENAKAITEAR